MFMDEAEQKRLEIVRARYSHEEQKELLREYVELRLLVADPMAAMKVYVLEPLCEYCRYGRAPMEDGESFVSSSTPVHEHRESCYMYPARDNGNYYAAAYGRIIRPADGHQISCVQCEEDLSDETMLYVRERSFQDYFCLEDEAHGLPKWLKRHVLDSYGRKCFSCGDPLNESTLTMDHIVPQAKGGDSRPTNLQAMCAPCNNNVKKDAEPQAAHIFLDFLTRPAPSDAYSGLIW